MKKTCIFIIILTILNYSNLKATTRNKSMMNSASIIANDSSAIFQNAASLMNSIRDSININYTITPFLEDEYIFNSSYSHIENKYAFGIGLSGEINKIAKYNNSGYKESNIYNNLFIINLAGAYAINDSSYIGANIKTLINNLENNNIYGAFIDISYIQSLFTPAFKIGFEINNFGFYDNVFASIDTDIATSLAYIKEDSSISVSIKYAISVPSINHNISVGVEAMILDFNKLNIMPNKNIDYDDLPESVLDIKNSKQKKLSTQLPSGILARFGVGNKGVSLGLGIYIDLFRIDYSIIFDNFNANNISHDIGLSFLF